MHESMTVGEIAARWPRTIDRLERLGVDYCCGGGSSLAQAARRAGIAPDALLADLVRDAADGAPGQERDWTGATMTELADHIEQTHHAFVRGALARAGEMAARAVRAHGERHPEFAEVQGVLGAFTEDMHDHMIREERVLFPWLRRLERPSEIQSGPPWSIRRPIDCMMHDHDDAGRALEKLRDLTNGYAAPADACGTVRALFRLLEEIERDTHVHIHKENNILFPSGVEAEARRKHVEAERGRDSAATA